jgi:hypothetical protein
MAVARSFNLRLGGSVPILGKVMTVRSLANVKSNANDAFKAARSKAAR